MCAFDVKPLSELKIIFSMIFGRYMLFDQQKVVGRFINHSSTDFKWSISILPQSPRFSIIDVLNQCSSAMGNDE